jgi:hypothetical protein
LNNGDKVFYTKSWIAIWPSDNQLQQSRYLFFCLDRAFIYFTRRNANFSKGYTFDGGCGFSFMKTYLDMTCLRDEWDRLIPVTETFHLVGFF